MLDIEVEAWRRWKDSGSVLYYLDPPVAVGLCHTVPLMKVLSEPPQLPFDCIYVQIPDGILSWDHHGETIELKGFYVHTLGPRQVLRMKEGTSETVVACFNAEVAWIVRGGYIELDEHEEKFSQLLRRYRDHLENYDVPWTLKFVGVMKKKGNQTALLLSPQEHHPGRPLILEDKHYDLHDIATLRMMANMVIALCRTRFLRERQVIPQAPKSAKKRAKAERSGRSSFQPYRLLYMDTDTLQTVRRRRRQGKTEGARKRAHLVMGHWHRYWVANPTTDDNPDREKEGATAPLHRVVRWIAPFIKGEGDLSAQTQILVKRWFG